jgi:hypothetical protein
MSGGWPIADDRRPADASDGLESTGAFTGWTSGGPNRDQLAGEDSVKKGLTSRIPSRSRPA